MFRHEISLFDTEISWYIMDMEISRNKEIKLLKTRFKDFPCVAILGPRQCGKTTLAHQFSKTLNKSKVHFFDLESPQDLARLENPYLALDELKGTIIIDEIQRKPDLFPILRVLIDKNKPTKYLILGSASRDLISQSSETLAGRISYIELSGFTINEIIKKDLQKLWIRGGFPRSFLSSSEKNSFQWRLDFISTFLERDIPNLGISIPPQTLRKFWTMLAHYHGQIFNASEIGRSIQSTDTTTKRYLDLLSGTFVIREIQPWYYNTKKRLIKRPKIYFRDSGLLHALLAIEDYKSLQTYPKLGASWEGFALEQVIQQLNLKEDQIFFWGVHTGAELDLVFNKKGKMWGVEVKYNEAPIITKSMESAISELSLSHLWVIYPGKKNYKLSTKISVVSIEDLGSIEV